MSIDNIPKKRGPKKKPKASYRRKVKFGTVANGSNLAPKNINFFSKPMKDPNGEPRPIVTSDYYQTFLYCPSVLHYSKGKAIPLNPYEIYCRFVLEETMNGSINKPSVVFAQHVNLFEEFEKNGKLYDRVWLITKGLFYFENFLKKIAFSNKAIVGKHVFRKKRPRLDIDITIEGLMVDEKKKLSAITFSPFKTAHEILWNPIHILQYAEVYRLQMELGYSRNFPPLYVAFTDDLMQWNTVSIKSYYRILEKEKMLMQSLTMNEIKIIHGYIAPPMACPNLECPYRSICLPNSAASAQKQIKKDLKFKKGKVYVSTKRQKNN